MGDQTTVDLRFAYRKSGDADWAETPWVSVSTPWVFLSDGGTHGERLIGLDSNTDYEFKAELRYNEIVIEGDVLTFTTEKIEPIVTTEYATDISTDAATLNMSFTVGDDSSVEVRFSWREYGTDSWAETTWASRESDGTHMEVLSGLDPATVYEFRAQLTYNDRVLPIEGDILSFTTKKEGLCFIATAAYGTPLAEEVEVLRDFRDEYLLNSPLGQGLVDVYYTISPPIAQFITEHPRLKPIVRVGLVPAVAMSTIAVNTTSVEKIVIIGLLVLVAVVLATWVTRRRGSRAGFGC
jgi:hypothetical protein